MGWKSHWREASNFWKFLTPILHNIFLFLFLRFIPSLLFRWPMTNFLPAYQPAISSTSYSCTLFGVQSRLDERLEHPTSPRTMKGTKLTSNFLMEFRLFLRKSGVRAKLLVLLLHEGWIWNVERKVPPVWCVPRNERGGLENLSWFTIIASLELAPSSTLPFV